MKASVITDQFLAPSKNDEKQNFPFKKFGTSNTLNRSGTDYIDNTRLFKPRGVTRKKINPSGVDGQGLKCLVCGSFCHLLNDCPDSWKNIGRANTNKELNCGNKEKVVCGKPKPIDGKIVSPDDVETLMVSSLHEKLVYLQDEIKQIKIDKDSEVQRQREELKDLTQTLECKSKCERQREELEGLKQTLKCKSEETKGDGKIGHEIGMTVLALSDNNHSTEKIDEQLRMKNVSTANKHGQKTSTITEKVFDNDKIESTDQILNVIKRDRKLDS